MMDVLRAGAILLFVKYHFQRMASILYTAVMMDQCGYGISLYDALG